MIIEQRLSTQTITGQYLYPDDQLVTDLADWELGGIGLSDISQGLQFQAWKCEVDSSGNVTLIPESVGDPVVILTKPGIIQCSFTFDQNMRWQLAYTLDDGTVEHIWYDAQAAAYTTTVYDAGEQSPRVCLDDKRFYQNARSDVLLIYIRGGTLFFRAQRNRFEVEYTLLEGLDSSAVLVNAGMNTKNRMQFSIKSNVKPPLPPPAPPAPPPGPPPPPPPPSPSPAPAPPAFVILTANLPAATVGVPYSTTIVTKDGAPPVTFSILAGAIPPGLLLSPSGVLSGTPTAQGKFNFRVQATDATNTTTVRELSATVAPVPAAVSVSGTIDPYAPTSFMSTGAMPYSQNYFGALRIRGGVPPYRLEQISGSLPPGTQFRTGPINGEDHAYVYLTTEVLVNITNLYKIENTYSFTLRLTDGTGAYVDSAQTFSTPKGLNLVNVSPPLPLDVTVYRPVVTIGAAFDVTFTFEGGVGEFKFYPQDNINQVEGLTLTKTGQKTLRMHGNPYVTASDPTYSSYVYRIWVEDSRGGLGGNGLTEVKFRFIFVNP